MSVLCPYCKENRMQPKQGLQLMCAPCSQSGVRPTIPDLMENTIRKSIQLLQDDQAKLAEEFPNLLPRERASYSKTINDQGRTVAALAKECRGIASDAMAWTKGAKFDDKKNLIVGFFRSLSYEQQMVIGQELMQICNEKEEQKKKNLKDLEATRKLYGTKD